MVERFNGRISDILRTHHFKSDEDLRTTLCGFVYLYNNELPQSALGGKTPMQTLQEWYVSPPSCSDESHMIIRDLTGRHPLAGEMKNDCRSPLAGDRKEEGRRPLAGDNKRPYYRDRSAIVGIAPFHGAPDLPLCSGLWHKSEQAITITRLRRLLCRYLAKPCRYAVSAAVGQPVSSPNPMPWMSLTCPLRHVRAVALRTWRSSPRPIRS